MCYDGGSGSPSARALPPTHASARSGQRPRMHAKFGLGQHFRGSKEAAAAAAAAAASPSNLMPIESIKVNAPTSDSCVCMRTRGRVPPPLLLLLRRYAMSSRMQKLISQLRTLTSSPVARSHERWMAGVNAAVAQNHEQQREATETASHFAYLITRVRRRQTSSDDDLAAAAAAAGK